jgi:hypothetical protein
VELLKRFFVLKCMYLENEKQKEREIYSFVLSEEPKW